VNKKKKGLFENRIGEARNQPNDLMKNISVQNNYFERKK
jgi:hypothetical protein